VGLWTPQKGRLRVEHNTGVVGVSNPGTAVTTGGSASTKGTPAELIAASAFDAYWICVVASNYGASATASQGALDILIGASTEELLIPNLLMGYAGGISNAHHGPKMWMFPLFIPAGSRLAAQAAGARTATDVQVGIFLYGGDGGPHFRCGRKVTTYGMGTVPSGTTLTPATSGGVDTYVQMTAGTSEDHFAFLPSFQVTGDTTTNNKSFCVEIGAGAATEETLGQWWFQTDATEGMNGPFPPMPVFADVPAGTRLAMRASCDSGSLDGGYNGVIHAVS